MRLCPCAINAVHGVPSVRCGCPPPFHRVTQCKYKRIGCPWQGPFHELTAHEAECSHPTKTGNELMGILDEMDQSHRKEMQLYNSIFSLLCFEKIGFTGSALPPGSLRGRWARGAWQTPRPPSSEVIPKSFKKYFPLGVSQYVKTSI